jgi:hypothetical protein
MLSILLLLTIMAAFTFGVSVGYWVIRGVLAYFDPARQHRKTTPAAVLATTSGD